MGSFWWRDILKLLPTFKDIVVIHIQNGSTALLWLDNWSGPTWSQRFPELFSFAKSHHTSVQMAASADHLHDLFHLPLSTRAYEQFQICSEVLHSTHVSTDKDVCSYTWGNGGYSCRKAYKHIVGHQQIHRSFRWLWNSTCQNKRKIFFWLVSLGTGITQTNKFRDR